MKLNILKRAGMLAACTAVCYGGIFGALTLNGLRYVRPTAENWWLLPYIEPAARIEQEVSSLVNVDGGKPEFASVNIVGYDEQDRQIWVLSSYPALRVRYSEHKVYNGDRVAWYNTGYGVKTTTYLQYDAQGRLLRMEYPDRTIIRSYHGDETEPYLVEDYNAQGALQMRTEWEYNPETGDTTRRVTYADNELLLDVEGVTVNKQGYIVSEGDQWTYDDAAHTAVCVHGSGAVETFWFDAQNRILRAEMHGPDRDTGLVRMNDYTDITR